MKKTLLFLAAGYGLLYLLLWIAYCLPYLSQHTAMDVWLWRFRGIISPLDLAIGLVFVLLPYLLLHDYYPARKIGKAIVMIALSLGLAYFFIFWLHSHPIKSKPPLLIGYFRENLFFYGLYSLYGIAFYFVQYARHKELEQQDLLLQNKQAELSFLRSQINPHFLFNNLNNIYSLVYNKSDQALPAIAGLSDLLRFMLYDTSEWISLEKEIVYLEKYIDLQMLRFEGAGIIDMSIDKDTLHWQVPPLLFIPFLENAFKHGWVGDGNGVRLRLRIQPDELDFYCRNKKTVQEMDATGGVGLENVKRRLALQYPGRHRLRIEDHDDEFIVNLQLNHG
jgi:hypothetical protein